MAAPSASGMHSGWLKKESEAKPGSLAKRWVVLDADLKLCCYKDTACDDLRCTVSCDGPGVRVSIVNGSYIQIDACVQNSQPLSSVTLKAETAAIALEWAMRLSPLVLKGSINGSQPHARSRRRSRHSSTAASTAVFTAVSMEAPTAVSTYSAFSAVSGHSPASSEDTYSRQPSHPGMQCEKVQTADDQHRELQVQVTEASPTSFPPPPVVPGSLAAPSPGKAGRSRRSRKPHRTNLTEVSLGGVSSGGTHRVRREGRRTGEQATAAGSPVLVAEVTARAAAHQVTAAGAAATAAAAAAAAAAHLAHVGHQHWTASGGGLLICTSPFPPNAVRTAGRHPAKAYLRRIGPVRLSTPPTASGLARRRCCRPPRNNGRWREARR